MLIMKLRSEQNAPEISVSKVNCYGNEYSVSQDYIDATKRFINIQYS